MIRRGDLWASPAGQAAFERIQLRVRQLWASNIYRFYHRHDGKLAGACTVRLIDGNIVVGMQPLIDPETGYDYGRAIRRGVPAGRGAYDPELGIRTRHGEYPGVSVAKFWRPWMTYFKPLVREVIREELKLAIRQYIRWEMHNDINIR